MSERERQLSLVEHYLDLGRPSMAMSVARELLGEYPEDAEAHALLALCLLDLRRLAAARSEAEQAMRLAPAAPTSIHAIAITAIAMAKFREAEHHIERLMNRAPQDPATWHLAAYLARMLDERVKARKHLERALSLAPNNPMYLSELGELELSQQRIDDAWDLAQRALQSDPTAADPKLLMAGVLLHRDELEEARRMVVEVLRDEPGHPLTLRRLAEIKARQNQWLGAWWRYHTWLHVVGPSRAILGVLLAFLSYRILVQLGQDLENPVLVGLVTVLWPLLCVYTWAAPHMFQRMVDAELAPVQLDEGF